MSRLSFWKQKRVTQITIDGKKLFLARMLPIASEVNRSMVQWDNSNVVKFEIDKVLVLDKFETLVLDPANATEWCV